LEIAEKIFPGPLTPLFSSLTVLPGLYTKLVDKVIKIRNVEKRRVES